jgi:hypothetical protein
MLHFVWTFLTPTDRLSATKVSPAWSNYHRLRIVAATTSLAPFCAKRAPPGQPTHLPTKRSVLYACALLRFHFYYGDFVRWLGGEYTNRHRDWKSTFQTLRDVCIWSPPTDLPPADFQWGFRICTEGVPILGRFDSPHPMLWQ